MVHIIVGHGRPMILCRCGRHCFRRAMSATLHRWMLQKYRAPPQDINVVVEIPQGSAVKYEVDKVSGAIFVDRFLFTATAYPSA
jgi:hypothetical protein